MEKLGCLKVRSSTGEIIEILTKTRADNVCMCDDADMTLDEFLAQLKGETTQLKSDFTEHKSAKNPHGTTASDVGALPKTGGTLSDDLDIECNTQASFRAISTANKRKSTFQQDALNTYIVNGSTEENTYFGFIFDSAADSIADKIKIVNRTNTERNLYRAFGEHNKPSGSYTGNGSATVRAINLGGIIGNAIVIKGAGHITFCLSGVGAFSVNVESGAIVSHNAAINFEANTLYLGVSNACVNGNGITYTWQVL